MESLSESVLPYPYKKQEVKMMAALLGIIGITAVFLLAYLIMILLRGDKQ